MTYSVWKKRGLQWIWMGFFADELKDEAFTHADRFAPAIVIHGRYVFRRTYLMFPIFYKVVYRSARHASS